MLCMKSINIVHGSKKKDGNMHTLNIKEKKILLSTGGGATCHHSAYFIHVLLFFIDKKFLCDVTDGYA